MSKMNVALKRFGGFMKRNAFYFLIVLCIASVAAVIALAVTRESASQSPDSSIPVVKPDEPDDPITPTDPDDSGSVEKQTFSAPTNGTVSKEYCDTALVFNGTLKEYATHQAIDFVSDDLKVYASASGTVKETGYNDLDGYYVTLTHDDGYETRYMSLDTQSTLKPGAKVTKGQQLGNMSTSQGTESLDGAHLHFEVLKDGKYINPLEVLVLEEK